MAWWFSSCIVHTGHSIIYPEQTLKQHSCFSHCYSPVIFSLSFIRIFINVSPQFPDCSQCRCSSSLHGAGQWRSRYPCPAFFTLVAHRKRNLIASTNSGWKDTWLVALKSMTDAVRRPNLCFFLTLLLVTVCILMQAIAYEDQFSVAVYTDRVLVGDT